MKRPSFKARCKKCGNFRNVFKITGNEHGEKWHAYKATCGICGRQTTVGCNKSKPLEKFESF